jgi:MFS family permease
VILVGIGAGSLASAWLSRRRDTGATAAVSLMVVQALFVVSTLVGLVSADARDLEAIVAADPRFLVAAGLTPDATVAVEPSWSRALHELWFNGRAILIEVAVPALLMGFAFPLGNAIVQRVEEQVGRRAGALYLANTIGAVCGALAVGFVLLPALGIQRSATILVIVATIAVLPLVSTVFYCVGAPPPTPDALAPLRSRVSRTERHRRSGSASLLGDPVRPLSAHHGHDSPGRSFRVAFAATDSGLHSGRGARVGARRRRRRCSRWSIASCCARFTTP